MMVKRLVLSLLLSLPSIVFSSRVDSLLFEVENAENPLRRAELYISIGDIYEYTSPSTAIEYYQKAYESAEHYTSEIAKGLPNPDGEYLKAKSLRYIGIVQSDSGEYEKALENYFQAIKIVESIENLYTSNYRNELRIKSAKILNNIGIVYSRQGVFGIASDYYLKALDVYTELNDSISIAVAYSSLGIVNARMANLTEALDYFQKSLDIFLLKSHLDGVGQSYNNIGNIHFQLSNWDQALDLYLKAQDIHIEMGYLQRLAATKGNIGQVYQNKNDFSKAFHYLDESLKIRSDLNDQAGMVESYNNIGNLYSDMGDLDKASEFYEMSLELSEKIGDQRMIAHALINKGELLGRQNLPGEAIMATLEGLDVAREHQLKFVEESALNQLAELYALASDYRNAYQYARKHFVLSQEILDEQKTKNINELQIEHKARENHQRIEILEQQSEFNQLRLRQSRTIAIFLGLLFITGLIIAVFAFILIKQRSKILLLKREQEAEKAIKKKQNDLKALLRTHAQAMILLDNDLNIVIYNSPAVFWFQKFLALKLEDITNFQNVEGQLSLFLKDKILTESLKGFSVEVEKDLVINDQKYFFKFFCNPVFEEDEKVIQSISLMIEDVSEQRVFQERIEKDLKEKETLIKEIHHRVKNNMQVIMSLIRMQSMYFKQTDLNESFRDLEQRIAAMSYVHEDLYRSENLSDIRFDDYIAKISSNLNGIFGGGIRVHNFIQMNDPLVNIDFAMPLGLVANELITNAIKHAFKTEQEHTIRKEKRIDVYFTENVDFYELKVFDNGDGKEVSKKELTSKSMGFQLIKIIVEEQLKGQWDLLVNGGYKFTVTIPKTKSKSGINV